MQGVPRAQFQFHFGPIIRVRMDGSTDNTVMFQFHFGPIIRPIRRHRRRRQHQVSIPLWSDYKRSSRVQGVPRAQFQFHFGPIIRVRMDGSTDNTVMFQFHFGPIISTTLPSIFCSLCKFQFHFGPIIRGGRCLIEVVFVCFNSTLVRL